MNSSLLGDSESISAGKIRANRTRERFLKSLWSDEIKFSDVVALSNLKDEHRYLSSIKLLDILMGRHGWTEATAREALSNRGFSDKDNVKSVRASSKKVERFGQIIELGPNNWRARPDFPPGWPFAGKLYDLFAANEYIDVTKEMSETIGPAAGDSHMSSSDIKSEAKMSEEEEARYIDSLILGDDENDDDDDFDALDLIRED